MKKIVILLVTTLMLVCALCACSNIGSDKTAAIEGKTYPFRLQLDSKKDPETREITLYFINGGDIPYVALSEYMPFVGEIYKDDKIGVPAVEYEISHPADNHTYVLRKDNSSSMDINTKEDTIEFVAYDYFVSTPGNNLLTSVLTLSESGRGGYSNLFVDDGNFSYERNGDALIEYNMKDYLIDMVEENGECYVPLQTINDLLVSQNYVFVVFNGVELIASSYSASLLDEMYEAPTGTMSEDFALFNYNELRFMLDTFYGLKSEHSITDFGEFFTSTGLFDDLAGTDPLKFDRAIRRMTMKYFDDGHSGMLKYSYLAGPAKKGDEEESLDMFDSIGESSN